MKPGYVAPDEVPKYVSQGTKYKRDIENMGVVGIGKEEPVEKKPLTAAQKKNLARKKKKELQQQQETISPPQPPKPNSGQKQPEKKDVVSGKSDKAESSSSNQSRVRGLSKKIRQAEQLEEKKKAGETLNADQEEKLARLEEMRKELEALSL